MADMVRIDCMQIVHTTFLSRVVLFSMKRTEKLNKVKCLRGKSILSFKSRHSLAIYLSTQTLTGGGNNQMKCVCSPELVKLGVKWCESERERQRERRVEKESRNRSPTISVLIVGPPLVVWAHLGFDVPLTPGRHNDTFCYKEHSYEKPHAKTEGVHLVHREMN